VGLQSFHRQFEPAPARLWRRPRGAACDAVPEPMVERIDSDFLNTKSDFKYKERTKRICRGRNAILWTQTSNRDTAMMVEQFRQM
jgi:hypothetical protein